MSKYIHKSHNVSVMLYHFVCPAKYRKIVFTKAIDETLKQICLEIEKRIEIIFLEIGVDKDHVHFLIQGLPNESAAKIIKRVKSITAREIFAKHPEVKKELWGGQFWGDGYFVNTVGKYTSEEAIANHIKNQWFEEGYQQLYLNLDKKEPIHTP